MNRTSRTARTAAVTLLALALPAVAAGTAHASGGSDDEVIRQGSCSGSTDWKIKAKSDDGRIEVESEIDSNRSGQTWRWVLLHDGSASSRGTSTTRGPSGSFDVERKTVNGPGSDSFRFRAVNNAGGEVCVAKLTF